MFEQLANMIGSVASAVGVITSSVGEVALGTSQSLLSVAHEMWKGIDLDNVSLHLDCGKCVVLHADAFAQLVADNVGGGFNDMPAEMRNELTLLVGRVTEWTPLLQLDRRQSLLHETFRSL